MMKIVLIGPIGYGKTTTGNSLLGDDFFTIGNDLNRVTTEIKIKQTENVLVVDCPGFGDATDASVFQNELLKSKDEMLSICPIDAFVLVTKFDCDKCAGFLRAAQNYVDSFGTEAIKSLMILSIQGNDKRRYSKEGFEKILYETDGYKYLLQHNDNKPIPNCLWDNYKYYVNQEETFDKCLSKLQQFDSIKMKYSFNLIEKDLHYQQKFDMLNKEKEIAINLNYSLNQELEKLRKVNSNDNYNNNKNMFFQEHTNKDINIETTLKIANQELEQYKTSYNEIQEKLCVIFNCAHLKNLNQNQQQAVNNNNNQCCVLCTQHQNIL